MSVAALDCGTNSTRLLVTDADGRTLERRMVITRLGQGVDGSGRLADEAIERVLRALEQYRLVMDELHCDRRALVATSAARDASNAGDFVARCAAVTGAEVAVIDGTQEAELMLLGATSDLAPYAGDTVVVDIGGGSTEVALRRGDVVTAYSMQLGCVRVTERVLGVGPVSASDRQRANDVISEQLDLAFTATPLLGDVVGRCRLVGVAGTVATLAQLVMATAEYDRTVVHHCSLTRADVEEWIDRLAPLEPSQRQGLPGIVAGREDVIVGGLLVLAAVMDRFAVSTLLSSENDILDGVATVLRQGLDVGRSPSLREESAG